MIDPSLQLTSLPISTARLLDDLATQPLLAAVIGERTQRSAATAMDTDEAANGAAAGDTARKEAMRKRKADILARFRSKQREFDRANPQVWVRGRRKFIIFILVFCYHVVITVLASNLTPVSAIRRRTKLKPKEMLVSNTCAVFVYCFFFYLFFFFICDHLKKNSLLKS